MARAPVGLQFPSPLGPPRSHISQSRIAKEKSEVEEPIAKEKSEVEEHGLSGPIPTAA